MIEALIFSYTELEKQTIALSKLLKIYQQQITKLDQKVALDRDQAIDLYWIDTLIKLCNCKP